jgi:glycosyltransferase involved in cell wall biosynthesis
VNRGAHNTRIIGIQKATGEYVFLLDGDDFIPDDALQLLYQKSLETNADIVDGDFKFVDENGSEHSNKNSYQIEGVVNTVVYLKVLIHHKALYQTFKIIKRHLFERVRLKEGLTIGEDAVSIVQIVQGAKLIAKINEVVYYYYKRSDSITFNPRRQNLIDAYKSSEYVISELQRFNDIFKHEILIIRLMSIINYCSFYNLTGPYRNNVRSVLKQSFNRKIVKTLNLSNRTKLACFFCLISPLIAHKVLKNKYILF